MRIPYRNRGMLADKGPRTMNGTHLRQSLLTVYRQTWHLHSSYYPHQIVSFFSRIWHHHPTKKHQPTFWSLATAIMPTEQAASQKLVKSQNSSNESKSIRQSIELSTSTSTSGPYGASQKCTSSPTDLRRFQRSPAPSPPTIEERVAWQRNQGASCSRKRS